MSWRSFVVLQKRLGSHIDQHEKRVVVVRIQALLLWILQRQWAASTGGRMTWRRCLAQVLSVCSFYAGGRE
jgi:hypothetical protein